MSEPRDPASADTDAAPEPQADARDDARADLAAPLAQRSARADSMTFAAGSNPSPPAASRPARAPHARATAPSSGDAAPGRADARDVPGLAAAADAAAGRAATASAATSRADEEHAATARGSEAGGAVGSARGVAGRGPASAADVAAVDDDPEPRTFGRYRLESVLGTGGMGVVHRAWDPQLERPVAIKVVRSAARDGSRQRLVREAQSLARLSHDNICRVFDVGTQDDEVWVVMELIDGCSLRDWARQHPDPDELLAILLDAGEGLAAAHAAGVIHRDVKPENVLVTREGRAIVTDFGLARVELTLDPIASTVTLDHSARLAGEDPHRTATGAIAGTPAYLSPEQLTGAELDARVDQFAWAVMAWELLTGMRPFPIHAGARLEAIRSGLTPPTSLPRPIGAALVRALSIAPRDRFASMRELLDTLQPFQPARRSDARAPRSRTARASTAPVVPSRDRTATTAAAAAAAAAARSRSPRARLARSPVLLIALAALASTALTIAIWQLTRTRVRGSDSPRAAALSGSAADNGTPAGSPAAPSAAGPTTGSLTTGAAGNVTTGAPGNVTTGAPGNVTTGAPGNVTTGAPGNVTTGAPGNVTTGAPGNVTTSATGNVTTSATGNLTAAGSANTGRTAGNLTAAGAADTGRGAGNVTTAGSADTGRGAGNVTTTGSASTGRGAGNVTTTGSASTGRGAGNVTTTGSASTGRGAGNVTAAGSGAGDAATTGGTGDRTARGSGDVAIETTPKTEGVGSSGATTTHANRTSSGGGGRGGGGRGRDGGGGHGGGGDGGDGAGDDDATARKLPPYKRGNALAMLEGFCRIPIDAAKPDPKLGKPVVDWGTVVRREIVKATIGSREQTMLLYEVKGQRGTYRFSGDTWWDTVGVLDVAPGGMVALCQDAILDMYKLPASWNGPLGRMEAVLPISRAPRTSELAKLDPLHVSDTALRRDGDAGRLTLPQGRRLLVRAKVEAADGKRWDMSRWWLEVPSGVPGAKLVAPGKRLWFVLEDPKLEEQPDGSKARLVVRAAAVVDDLFP